MFNIKKETVKITNDDGTVDVYNVVPLSGKYLTDLWSLVEALPTDEEGSDTESLVKTMSEGAAESLYNLVVATLVKSYPSQNKEELEQFASQNMFKFMQAIIKVNMPSGE